MLETLQRQAVQALKSPQVLDAYAKQMISRAADRSLDEAKTWIGGQIASWQKITKEIKIDLAD